MKKKILKQNNPLVSVIMPVYNGGDFLMPAIDSILRQTYQHFELIIVNDASTDDSLTVMRKYAKRFPTKIRLINLTRNLNRGGDACANKGIEIARGEFIARMDADDISHPSRLEKQVAYLMAHPEVFLVGSNASVINKDGAVIGEKLEPLSSEDIYKGYLTFHPLIHPTTMFRRTFKRKPFRYEIKYSANNDYYTFFKTLCRGGKFVNLPEELVYYRIHGKNDTFNHMKNKFVNTLRIRYEMCRYFGYRPTLKGIIMTLLQMGIIFVLPEQLIAQLYFITKGIKKISLPSLSLPFRKERGTTTVVSA